MSEKFDPYYRWLGIPPKHQPPDHYRLLGLEQYESNREVIRDAVEQRIAHVRTYQLGPHSALSQTILNELAAAKVCLLNAEKKTAYDEALRQRAASNSGPANESKADSLDPGLAAVLETETLRTMGGAAKRRGKKSRSSPVGFIVAGTLTVVALGAAAVWITFGHDNRPGDEVIAKAGNSAKSAMSSKAAAPKSPEALKKEASVSIAKGSAAAAAPKTDLKSEIPKSEPETVATVKPQRIEPLTETRGGAAGIAPPLAVAPFTADTAKMHQERWAKFLGVPVVETNSIGMKLVLIPAGEFQMGSPKELIEAESRLQGAPSWYKDYLPREGPQHRVRITRPYWLGATLVTQEEYQRVMGGNPSHFQGDPSRPVEQVSWNDALEFCQRLSDLPGERAARRRYGLPTEAQWEYACRAGTTTRWYSGDDEASLVDVGWFNTNAGGQTHPVGQKRSNGWGLYDMHGNVIEWCRDWYDQDYYRKSATDDPGGPDGGSTRAARGGSKYDPAGCCRSAGRFSKPPGDHYKFLGFRVCKLIADTAAEPAETSRANDVAEASAAAILREDLKSDNLKSEIPQSTPEAGDRSAEPRPALAVAPFNAETAKLHQERWAKYLGVPVVQSNSVGMKLVLIPPGEFQMGSPKELIDEELRLHGDDKWYIDRLPSEGPQHRVRITSPYWLGATDVTQEEYQRVMDSNPSKFQGDSQRPVEQVSWKDAAEFCRRLSEMPGEKAARRRYGLPTEAQWEYACRAGTTTRWSSGDDAAGLGTVAWFTKNAHGHTHPVAQKRANAWGLYDMHGNVWQWCREWYDKDYYATSPTDDPAGPPAGSSRVFRGGGWRGDAKGCRSTQRSCHGPSVQNCDQGFRVCQVLAETQEPEQSAGTGTGSNHAEKPPAADTDARRVSLTGPPYPRSYAGAETDKLSVQYAVIEVLKQAGLKYDFKVSLQRTDPICRQWIRPQIVNQSWREALESILGPVGLTYKIKGDTVVLKRR